MTLQVLDIPDDPQQLNGWLESCLIGLELGDVVAELAAVHEGDSALALDDVLGGQRGAVLEAGLSALDAGQARRLLRNPVLLLQLQELVFVEGGDYWTQLARNAETDDGAIDAVWSRLQPSLGAPVSTPVVVPEVVSIPWHRRPLVVSLATAALVLLAVQLADRFGTRADDPGPGPQANVGWGWDKPGALPQDLPAD